MKKTIDTFVLCVKNFFKIPVFLNFLNDKYCFTHGQGAYQMKRLKHLLENYEEILKHFWEVFDDYHKINRSIV